MSSIVIRLCRFGTRHSTGVSSAALLLILLLGVAYLSFGALRIDPFRPSIHVRVELAQSGGLLAGQDVTLRGIPIGRVDAVALSGGGVVATLSIDGDARIPVGTPASVSALSAAGEQYLDFRPAADAGPYLRDGSVVPDDQTSTPVPIATVLSSLDGFVAQIDPAKFATIVHELGVSDAGPAKLAAILDGGTWLISTLDAVLPQTVRLIRNSRTVLTMLHDTGPGLRETAADLSGILGGVADSAGGYRTLVDNAPHVLSAVDDVIADNSPTMVALLGNLATVAQLSYLRTPALEALFPDHRGSTIEAIGSALRDGGFWVTSDIYPRYSCDYGLPRLPPAIPDYPEPYLYTYCSNPDPSVLVRGARNAPRPPGDDTAAPPPGVDPLTRADPTPVGPLSIPTPYGGPDPSTLTPPN